MDMKHDTSSRRRGRIGAALFVICAAIIGAIGLFGVAQRPGVLIAADCSRGSGSASTPPTYRAALRAAADVWDGTTKTQPTIDGSTIKITSAAELAWLATDTAADALANADELRFESDIDLGGHEWTPISRPGSITINGGGHVIKGLKITGSKNGPVGLFFSLEGSIADLHLVDVNIDVVFTTMSVFAGALAGSIGQDSEVDRCTVQGVIKLSGADTAGSNAAAGGLFGMVEGGDVSFENVAADITISNSAEGEGSSVGGIVGTIATKSEISEAVVRGSVFGNARAVGGVVGEARIDGQATQGDNEVSFSNISNYASVTLIGKAAGGSGTDSYGAGGIVGVMRQMNGMIKPRVESCANFGVVKMEGTAGDGSRDVRAGAGGLIGTIDNVEAIEIWTSVNDRLVSSSFTTGANQKHLGVGGIIGAAVEVGGPDAPFSVQYTANVGGVENTQADAYAGGLIGYILAQSGGADICRITGSYNQGSVRGVSDAGGILGSASVNGGQGSVDSIALEYVYNSAVPTVSASGGVVGGIAARLLNGVTLNPDASNYLYQGTASAPKTIGDPQAQSQPEGNNLSAPAAFTGVPAWGNYFETDGSMPPAILSEKFDEYAGFVIGSAKATKRSDGSVAIRLYELPNEMIRNDAGRSTIVSSLGAKSSSGKKYIVETADGSKQIASGLEVNDDVLVIPADAGLTGGDVIRIHVDEKDAGDPVLLSLVFSSEPSGGGEVRAIAVRGTPIVPEDSTSRQLYIEWTDADGVAHSSDRRPSDSPTITWSVDEPESPNWDVSVAPASDAMGATLTIGASKSEGTSPQEYGVRVRVSYGAASEDIVYVRKFYAGSFPTKVTISPEDEAMIDAANAVLARTRVSILPGNFQRPIPDHIKHLIESRLAEGLVNYATDQGALSTSLVRAAADPSLYVLGDMNMIQSMMHEPAQSVASTLPVCFKTASKDSANIELDLGERPELAGHVVLLPMTYSVTFTAENMQAFFGANAPSILASPTSEESLAKIFDVLVLHKRIKEGDMTGWYTRLVDGVASPSEALALGMLQVDASDGELTVRLAYNVINFAGESFVVSAPYTEGGSDTTGYIILPDGLQNSRLVDPLWSNLWARGSGGDTGGGGGGGCAVGSLAVVAFGALCVAYRRRSR